MSASVHAFDEAERRAFVRHINETLAGCQSLADRLPLDPDAENAIFDAVRDGLLLCELINAALPGTINESLLVKNIPAGPRALFCQLGNHRLALDAARRIGCQLVNISGEDLIAGRPYLVLGLLWQIVRCCLLLHVVSLRDQPDLMRLLSASDGEDMRNVPAEAVLTRWFNWHLDRVGAGVTIRKFGAELADGVAYLHLLHSIDPTTMSHEQLQCALNQPLDQRLQHVISCSTQIDPKCALYLTAEDIRCGREKLNLCFIATLFSSSSGMAPLQKELEQSTNAQIAALTERVAALETENRDLKQQLDRQHMQLLSTANEKKVVEEQLFTRTADWEARNHSLQLEAATLKLQMCEQDEELKHSLSALSQERRQAETFGMCADTLTEELHAFRSRQEKMEFLIEHLKMERARSDTHVRLLRSLFQSFPTTESLCRAVFCGNDQADSSAKLTLDRVIDGCAKAGYLTKKARDSSGWRMRFIVIRDNFLFYFKSDSDPRAEPKGVVRLDDAQTRFTENPTKADLPPSAAFMCITVPDHGHNKDTNAGRQSQFYLTGTLDELEMWKVAIGKAEAWWTRKSSLGTMKDEMRRRLSTSGVFAARHAGLVR